MCILKNGPHSFIRKENINKCIIGLTIDIMTRRCKLTELVDRQLNQMDFRAAR